MELHRLRVDASILRHVHMMADEHYKSHIGGSSHDPMDPRADVKREEPKYSGNRVCPICHCSTAISMFFGHKECQTCREEAYRRYNILLDALDDFGSEVDSIRPSEDVYIEDMLRRMHSGENQRNTECVVVDEIPDEFWSKDNEE